MMKTRAFWIGSLGGLILAAVIGLIGFFALPALGMIEMTAIGQPGLLDWWGHTNWRNSVEWRARKQQIPATADPAKGMEHYRSSCLPCHGAPDVKPAEWSHHMRPNPPELWENATQQFDDGELFYVISKGVRMTGMPAFGPKHNTNDIWNIVAFVRHVDHLSASEQKRLQESAQRYQHQHGAEHQAQDDHEPAGHDHASEDSQSNDASHK